MARGTAFSELVSQLRDELGRANSASVGVSDLSSLKQTINRVYESVYDEYDWPHLRKHFTRTTLSAGQQYYDFPDGLNYERIESARVWYNSIPIDIRRGITVDDYAAYDPAADERSDPALAWDVKYTGSGEQMEIWPLPASSTQKIQFTGLQSISTLVDDADTCLIDDKLVVLFSAAQLLRRQKSEDAETVLSLARARFQTLRRRSKGAQEPVRMGLGDSGRQRSANRTTVYISS